MKGKLLAGLFVTSSFLMGSGPLFAHHASTWADTEHPRTLTGTVMEWNWINPHVRMVLAVKDEAGNVEPWTIEFNSPQSLRRSGMTISSVKAGDEVTLTGSPSKDGRKYMAHQGSRKVLVNGQELSLQRAPRY